MADRRRSRKRNETGVGNAFLTADSDAVRREPERATTRNRRGRGGGGARGDWNGNRSSRGGINRCGRGGRGGEWGSCALGETGGFGGTHSQQRRVHIMASATRASRNRDDAGRWMRIERLSCRADLLQTTSRLVDRFLVYQKAMVKEEWCDGFELETSGSERTI